MKTSTAIALAAVAAAFGLPLAMKASAAAGPQASVDAANIKRNEAQGIFIPGAREAWEKRWGRPFPE